MIYGIGTDIVQIARIEKLCMKQTFRDKVFTKFEQNYCDLKHTPHNHYASRYAAKEATLKAFGYGMREGVSWHDMEIKNDALGKPTLILSKKIQKLIEKQLSLKNKCINVDLSLSDEKEYAIAFVVISSKDN